MTLVSRSRISFFIRFLKLKLAYYKTGFRVIYQPPRTGGLSVLSGCLENCFFFDAGARPDDFPGSENQTVV